MFSETIQPRLTEATLPSIQTNDIACLGSTAKLLAVSILQMNDIDAAIPGLMRPTPIIAPPELTDGNKVLLGAVLTGPCAVSSGEVKQGPYVW